MIQRSHNIVASLDGKRLKEVARARRLRPNTVIKCRPRFTESAVKYSGMADAFRFDMAVNRKANRKRMELLFFLAACTGLNATGQSVPPGAAALGYTNCVFNDSPTAAEIAPGSNGYYKWFSGLYNTWQSTAAPLTSYSTVSNVLALNYAGTDLDLSSTPLDFSMGAVNLLSGTNGFYVEADVQLTDNGSDHWACFWLEPMELGDYLDFYPPDPPGYERWMEFDVQESGWDPGLLGTVHNWTGIYFDATSISNPNNWNTTPLDMSQKHTFGGSYDPITQQTAWWVDGVLQMSAGPPYVPAIAARQHFYLILSAYTHGNNTPYSMYVSGVRAYLPGVPPAPPTGLRIISE
jgi:hypothetical protein